MTPSRLASYLVCLMIAGQTGGCGPAPCACTDLGVFDGGTSDVSFDTSSADTPAALDAPVEPDAAPDASVTVDAPVPLRNQVYTPSCGPADGPAFRIGIFESRVGASCDGDLLRRTLTFAVDDLGGAVLPPAPGATITSTMANPNGLASDCPGGRPPCRVSSDFVLTFDTFVEGVSVTGSYVITWVDGSTSEDVFDAMWCESGGPVCG